MTARNFANQLGRKDYLWSDQDCQDRRNGFFLARISDPPPVELKIATTASSVAVSWPVTATNYVLETTTSLPAVSWTTVTNTPTVTIHERSVQLPLTGEVRFFRLRQP